MGIDGSSKIVWTANNVHPKEIINIFRTHDNKSSPIRIDVDILNIYHRCQPSFSHSDCINHVANLLHSLAQCGFVVCGVLDGDIRPSCKRATMYRNGRAEMASINSYFCRQSAMTVGASLDEEGGSLTKRKKGMLELLNKEAKRLDNASFSRSVPNSLKDDLEQKIFQVKIAKPNNLNDGYVKEEVIQAMFQADSMMAYRYHNNQVDLIFSNDTDFGIFLGPDAFIVRSVSQNAKNTDNNNMSFEISGYCNEKLSKLKRSLRRKNIGWKHAKFPVFRSTDPILRSYVAITLGCDVFPGINHLGPSKVHEALSIIEKNNQNDQCESFLALILQKAKKYLKGRHVHTISESPQRTCYRAKQ